jgi:hypothetical protein
MEEKERGELKLSCPMPSDIATSLCISPDFYSNRKRGRTVSIKLTERAKQYFV